MSSVHTKYGLAAYRSALSVFSIFVGSGKFCVPLKAAPLKLNVGGEGEIPGFINVQGRWVSDHAWPGSSRSGNSLQQPQDEGHKFLFADDMSKLPYNTGTVD